MIKAVICGLLLILCSIAARADTDLPVDMFRKSGVTPAVAYSMWRALYASYDGPLFILARTSDSTTTTIKPVGPGGEYDVGAVTSFCGAANVNGCSVLVVCDQMVNTCSASNNAVVTISNGTPSVITWTGSNLVQDTPVFFDFKGHKANNLLPSGLSPDLVYFVARIPAPTANTFSVSATVGGAAINTTTAGTGAPFTANLTGFNDLTTLQSTTTPLLTYVSMADGSKIPVLATRISQEARNRLGIVNVPDGTVADSIYALFGTNIIGICCGSFGSMEKVLINQGQGAMETLALADPTGTGNPCTGPSVGPCLTADLENGIFASYLSSVVTFTNGTPTVVTYGTASNIALSDISPDTPLFFATGTMPTGLVANTIYYIARAPAPTSTTFSVSATVGGAALPTTSTGTAPIHVYLNPQPSLTSGFAWGFITCNGGAGTDFTLDMGTEQNPYLQYAFHKLPVGYSSCNAGNSHLRGGVSIGEGGDGSMSPSIFLEGVIGQGQISYAYRQKLHEALYKRFTRSTPPTGLAFNFINGSTPAGWTFTRAACTGGSAPNPCVTDASYGDAAGVTYHTFVTDTPIFNANGLGLFTKRSNWVVNSDCDAGTCPVTQTTPSLGVAKYILFCNSTGTITSSAGTAVGTGFGAQACNTGTYQNINITTAGTVTLTFSGSFGAHNWADLQNAATITEAPTPHIITNGGTVPVLRNDDVMAIGGTAANWLETDTAAAIVEATVATNSGLNGTAHSGFFLGGSATGADALWYDLALQNAGIDGIADGSFSNIPPIVGTPQRLGANFTVGGYTMSLNGVFSSTDTGSVGSQAVRIGGLTHYLGYSLPRHIDCNCYVSRAAFYPYTLPLGVLNTKSTVGTALP